MTKKELKRLVNAVDVVKVYNKNLTFFSQINKTQFLLEIEASLNTHYKCNDNLFETRQSGDKITLFIY